MAYKRSIFPEGGYDEWNEVYDLPPSMVTKANEFKFLKTKDNKNQSEIDRLNQLTTELQDYIISPELFNSFANALTSTQKFFVENVNDYIDEMQGTLDDLVETTTIARGNTITATNNAVSVINNYNMVVTSTKKTYMPYVATFTDIATTYPTPEVGWTVTAIDTGIQYRWDGVDWVGIGIDTKIGYNVWVGETEPPEDNLLWLEVEGVTGYQTRIFVDFNPPPTDDLIWLDLNS